MRAQSEAGCPYCGGRAHGGPVQATCAVCGMEIRAGHFPHIVRVEPRNPSAHFCSVACLDNSDFLGEGDDG